MFDVLTMENIGKELKKQEKEIQELKNFLNRIEQNEIQDLKNKLNDLERRVERGFNNIPKEINMMRRIG